MKLAVAVLLTALLLVECKHVFMGTNVERPLVHHGTAKHSALVFRKRVETYSYTLPAMPNQVLPRYIQGIMAYDLTNSEASMNVTEGGIGSNTVKLRMKSARGHPLHYDIYIYA